jgi:hypothetical protein
MGASTSSQSGSGSGSGGSSRYLRCSNATGGKMLQRYAPVASQAAIGVQIGGIDVEPLELRFSYNDAESLAEQLAAKKAELIEQAATGARIFSRQVALVLVLVNYRQYKMRAEGGYQQLEADGSWHRDQYDYGFEGASLMIGQMDDFFRWLLLEGSQTIGLFSLKIRVEEDGTTTGDNEENVYEDFLVQAPLAIIAEMTQGAAAPPTDRTLRALYLENISFVSEEGDRIASMAGGVLSRLLTSGAPFNRLSLAHIVGIDALMRGMALPLLDDDSSSSSSDDNDDGDDDDGTGRPRKRQKIGGKRRLYRDVDRPVELDMDQSGAFDEFASEKTVDAFVQWLAVGAPSLAVLDLRCGPIGPEGFTELLQSIAAHRSLKTLSLDVSGVDVRHVVELDNFMFTAANAPEDRSLSKLTVLNLWMRGPRSVADSESSGSGSGGDGDGDGSSVATVDGVGDWASFLRLIFSRQIDRWTGQGSRTNPVNLMNLRGLYFTAGDRATNAHLTADLFEIVFPDAASKPFAEALRAFQIQGANSRALSARIRAYLASVDVIGPETAVAISI